MRGSGGQSWLQKEDVGRKIRAERHCEASRPKDVLIGRRSVNGAFSWAGMSSFFQVIVELGIQLHYSVLVCGRSDRWVGDKDGSAVVIQNLEGSRLRNDSSVGVSRGAVADYGFAVLSSFLTGRIPAS